MSWIQLDDFNHQLMMITQKATNPSRQGMAYFVKTTRHAFTGVHGWLLQCSAQGPQAVTTKQKQHDKVDARRLYFTHRFFLIAISQYNVRCKWAINYIIYLIFVIKVRRKNIQEHSRVLKWNIQIQEHLGIHANPGRNWIFTNEPQLLFSVRTSSGW